MKKKTSILIITLFLLATLGTGYWMYNLYAHDQLWSDLPLYFYFSAWMLFVFLTKNRLPCAGNNCKWLIYSTISGVLLALGFPDSPLTPLMFIGFIPLLIVENELSKSGEGKWTLFKYSYHAFMIWNILTTYWVGNSALIAGTFAIMANSLLMTIPILFYSQITKIFKGKYDAVAFIVFWISFEKIHQNWELSWPWLTLGNSFAKYPSWVQWYEYLGTFGGSLWILLVNFIGFKIFQKYQKEKNWDKIALIKWSSLIVIPILISLVMYYNYTPIGTEKNIVVVQPNYEPHYKKFAVSQREVLAHFLKLSEKFTDEKTDYLIYPETSFGNIKTNDFKSNRVIRQLENFVKKYPKLNLITGVAAYKTFEKGEDYPKRTGRDLRNGGHWESYNGMIQINNSDKIDFYKKNKFVPGVEIFPYSDYLFFFKFIVKNLGGSAAGLGGQKERSVFSSSQGRVAPAICYESIYGEYMSQFVRNGAQALIVSTNDGWWDDTPGHIQHLEFASLRAIETRKDVIRSANSGISAFVNQRGDIIQRTQYNEATTIKGVALFNDRITFYTQWGDLIVRISYLLSVILIVVGIKQQILGESI